MPRTGDGDDVVQCSLDVRKSNHFVQLLERAVDERFVRRKSGFQTRRYIDGFDAGEPLRGEVGESAGQYAAAHVGNDLRGDEAGDHACVAEMFPVARGVLDLAMDECADARKSFVAEGVSVLFGRTNGDLEQFLFGVILEMEGVGEAGFETFVRIQHLLHLVGVAGKDDDHVSLLFAQLFEQAVEDLGAVVFLVVGVGNEGVGFVDEEDVAMRLFEGVLGVLLGVADVLADQFFAIHIDHVARLEDADRGVYLAQQPRDGGLACTRIAGEDHVQRRHDGFEAVLAAQLGETHQVEVRLDVVFEFLESDEVVEFAHCPVKAADLGLRHIFGLQFAQCLRILGQVLRCAHDTLGHVHDHGVDECIDVVGRYGRKRREVRCHGRFGAIGEDESTVLALPLRDLHHLVERQIWQLVYLSEIVAEVSCRKQLRHALRRIGQDDAGLAVVMHHTRQMLDRIVLVAARVFGDHRGGVLDKEHVAFVVIVIGLHPFRAFGQVAPARGIDFLQLGIIVEQLVVLVEIKQHICERRLAGTLAAHDHRVEVDRRRGEVKRHAALVELLLLGQRCHLTIHCIQADQIGLHLRGFEVFVRDNIDEIIDGRIDRFAILVLDLEREIIASAIQRFVICPLNDKLVEILARAGMRNLEVEFVVKRVQTVQVAHRVAEEKEIA